MRIGLGLGLTNRYKLGTAAVPDVTAPILSVPLDTKTGDTTATVGATTNESGGILYYYLSASSSPPTAANLKSGSGALASGSAVVTATGARTISITGLTPSTTYYAHLLHRDGSGNDSNIVSGDGFTTDASSTTVNISTAPTIAGDPIVGQRLYATNGTYNVTPDSITGQWYKDGSAISGETADNYLVQDADVGSVLAWKETAAKAGYTSSPLNASANTAAVTDINLTGAIDAFSRTSSSGVTPMTYSVGFGSNVYAGYGHTRHVYSDSGRSTLVREDVVTLTNGMLDGSGALPGITVGSTEFLEVGVLATSPNGVPHVFTYPDAISPTDAVVAMTWSTVDRDSDITLTNSNLTAYAGGSGAVRTNRGFSSGKRYIEFVTGPYNRVGLYNLSADLTTNYNSTASPHAATFYANDSYANYNTTGFSVFADNGVMFTGSISDTTLTVTSVNLGALAVGQYLAGPDIPWGTKITALGTGAGGNGTYTLNNSVTLASTAHLIAGPVVAMAVDKDADLLWWAVNNVWQNSGNPAAGTSGLAIAGIGAPVFPAFFAGGGGVGTALNPGNVGFIFTPPTGFVAP